MRRAIGRVNPSTKNRGAISATAVLGAVVTGGLMASQANSTPSLTALADAASGSLMTVTAAASSPESLLLERASNEASLPTEAPGTGGDVAAASTRLPGHSFPNGSLDQRDLESLHMGDALAHQASAAHAASAREAYILNGGGDLDDWIGVALHKLGLHPAWAPAVKRVILEESRGNPLAINRWDSNAMAGRPSQGLMQVIPSTYMAYVLPELAGRPITNPVANITAGIRYMLAHYGYPTLGAGGRYIGGSYVGY
jgi:soluble lytic murein transglycosylase-like protein